MDVGHFLSIAIEEKLKYEGITINEKFYVGDNEFLTYFDGNRFMEQYDEDDYMEVNEAETIIFILKTKLKKER